MCFKGIGPCCRQPQRGRSNLAYGAGGARRMGPFGSNDIVRRARASAPLLETDARPGFRGGEGAARRRSPGAPSLGQPRLLLMTEALVGPRQRGRAPELLRSSPRKLLGSIAIPPPSSMSATGNLAEATRLARRRQSICARAASTKYSASRAE